MNILLHSISIVLLGFSVVHLAMEPQEISFSEAFKDKKCSLKKDVQKKLQLICNQQGVSTIDNDSVELLKDIPYYIGSRKQHHCTNLWNAITSIDFSYNKLTHSYLPLLGKMPNLTKLNLEHNEITQLSFIDTKTIPSNSTISLRYNQISLCFFSEKLGKKHAIALHLEENPLSDHLYPIMQTLNLKYKKTGSNIEIYHDHSCDEID